MERSCDRSSDVLRNISSLAMVEVRIRSEKLYSDDLNEEFSHKFGLSSSNVRNLKEALYDMERKGEYVSFIINTVVSIL